MAYNNIENEILRVSGENIDTPDVFIEGSAELLMLRTFINDAIQELCMLSGVYRKNYILTTKTNRMFYRIVPQYDYISFINFILDRSRQLKLVKTELESIAKIDSFFLQRNGNASHYVMFGNEFLMLYPKPTSSYALTINFTAIPKSYTESTDPIKIRKDYERAVIYDSLSKYYAYNRELDKAVDYMKMAYETAKIDSNLLPEKPVRFEGRR